MDHFSILLDPNPIVSFVKQSLISLVRDLELVNKSMESKYL